MTFKKKFAKASDFTTVTKRPLASKLKKDLVRIAHDIDRHNLDGKEYVDVLKEFLSQFSNPRKNTKNTQTKTTDEEGNC